MRWILVTTAALVVMAAPSAFGGEGGSDKTVLSRVAKVQNRAEAAQLQRLSQKVTLHRGVAWSCQDDLGVTRTRAETKVWLLPRSVAYRAWVAEKWQGIALSCKTLLQKRTIPATNDWVTAVRLVQRIYPGTSDWLLYISRREGGHGPFVMNHQGSGAGGWMQFMASTYWAYSDDAFADARARGFIIDASWNQWTHPLGQAITAGYMRFTGRDGCHWCL